MGIHEDRLFALLKEGEATDTNEDQTTRGYTNVYEDPPDRGGQWGEPGPQAGGRQAPIVFSDAAVEGEKDTRHGTLGRVLSSKDQAATASRALIAANLSTASKGDFETSAPLLQKVSYPRGRTLSEQVIKTVGRL